MSLKTFLYPARSTHLVLPCLLIYYLFVFAPVSYKGAETPSWLSPSQRWQWRQGARIFQKHWLGQTRSEGNETAIQTKDCEWLSSSRTCYVKFQNNYVQLLFPLLISPLFFPPFVLTMCRKARNHTTTLTLSSHGRRLLCVQLTGVWSTP